MNHVFRAKSLRSKVIIVAFIVTLIVGVLITLSNGGRSVWTYLAILFFVYIYYSLSSNKYADEVVITSNKKLLVKYYTRPFVLTEEEYDLKKISVSMKLKSFTKVSKFYLLTVRDEDKEVLFQMTNELMMWNVEQLEEVKLLLSKLD